MSFGCPVLALLPVRLCGSQQKYKWRPHTMVHSPFPHLFPSFTTKSLSHMEWTPTSIHTPPPQELVFSYPGVKRKRTTVQFTLGRTDWGRGSSSEKNRLQYLRFPEQSRSEERSSVGITPYWRGWLCKVLSQGQRP